MIGAVAHVREFGAVGRPAHFGGSDAGARANQRRGTARSSQGRAPDLPAEKVRHAIAFGRDFGRVSYADLARRFARGGNPDRLFNARRVCHWIRVGSPEELQVTAADVDHGAGVGCPAQLANVLSIVLRVVGETLSLVIRGGGDPDVAGAALVEQPRDFAAAGRSHQFGRERRGEHLLQGKRLADCAARYEKRGKQQAFHVEPVYSCGAFCGGIFKAGAPPPGLSSQWRAPHREGDARAILTNKRGPHACGTSRQFEAVCNANLYQARPYIYREVSLTWTSCSNSCSNIRPTSSIRASSSS